MLLNKKGFAFLPVLIISIVAIAGLTIYRMITVSTSATAKDPISIFTAALQNIPWNSVVDYFVGGLFGILMFLSNYVIKPLTEYIMSVVTQSETTLPAWLGYVMTGLLILMVIWKLWGRIWEFVMDNWMRVLIILLGVFVIGIMLVYMGLV